MTIAKWIPLDELRPEPEVFVLCWDGKNVVVDWFGSLIRPQGTAYTHWAPFEKPPGAASDMLDGNLAFSDRLFKLKGRHP